MDVFLTIFFGEPLLVENLEEYIELSRNILPENEKILYTNGDHLNEIRLLKMLAYGVDKIIITNHNKCKVHPVEAMLSKMPLFIQKKIIYQKYNSLKLSNRSGILANDIQNYKGVL